MPPNLRSIEVISETPQGSTQEEENQQAHQEKSEVALKGVNGQQEDWRLRVRKLVLDKENDYENRGCQYWEPVRYPFDDLPYQHVTRTPRDRVTPRRLEVISKIAAVEGVQYRCAHRTRSEGAGDGRSSYRDKRRFRCVIWGGEAEK